MTTPYIDILDAQDYFNGRLGTASWDDANDTDKLKALTHATRLINNLKFVGQRNVIDQTNEFPRLGQSDVPMAIKEATCELALQLLDDVDPEMEISETAMSQGQLGTIRSHSNRDFTLVHIRNGIPSSEAWARLLPYLSDPLSIKLVKI